MIALSLLLTSPFASGGDLPLARTSAGPPLHLVENRGQWDTEILFASQTGGTRLQVHRDGITFDTVEKVPFPTDLNLTQAGADSEQARRGHRVRMRVVGADGNGEAAGWHRLETVHHFLKGPKTAWRRHVPEFAGATIRNVRPGVDLRLYGVGTHARYDLILRDPNQANEVAVKYEGAANLRISPDGSLTYDTSLGTVRESGRFAYGATTGEPVPLAVRITSANTVTYQVPRSAEPIVIDPQFVVRSAGYGGDGTFETNDVVVTPTDDVILAGVQSSTSSDIGTPGAYEIDGFGDFDAMLIRFDPSLTRVRSASYFGGGSNDAFCQVEMLPDGHVAMAISTDSVDTFLTPPFNSPPDSGDNDIYVIRVVPDLSSVAFGAMIGAGSAEGTPSLAVSPQGWIGISSHSVASSREWPRVNVSGPLTNRSGATDATFAVFRPDLRGLLLSGVAGGDRGDNFSRIAFTSEGQVILASQTRSTDLAARYSSVTWGLPAASPSTQDIAIFRIRRDGTLIGATHAGARAAATLGGLAVQGSGSIYISGSARGDMPFTAFPSAYSTTFVAGVQQGYIMRFRSDLRMLQAGTYINFDGTYAIAGGLALSNSGQVITIVESDGLAGSESPAVRGGLDGFVVRFDPNLSTLIDSGAYGGSGFDLRTGDISFKGPYRNIVFAGITTAPFDHTPGAYLPADASLAHAFLQEVSFTRDPLRINLGQDTIPSGSYGWAGVEMNGRHSSPVTVTLSSSNPSVMVPNRTTVTVPAGGLLSSSFKVVGRPVVTPTTVDLRATASGRTITVPVTIVP